MQYQPTSELGYSILPESPFPRYNSFLLIAISLCSGQASPTNAASRARDESPVMSWDSSARVIPYVTVLQLTGTVNTVSISY